jgi:hypothetical protein
MRRRAVREALSRVREPLFCFTLSDQVHHAFLRFRVSLNVALGRAERAVSSQHLNVSERATDSGDRSSCIGDKRSSARAT